MIKVAVFGASGIVGQHMALSVPAGIEAHFFRRETDLFFTGIDLTDRAKRDHLLHELRPDVIVNLAGENRVDVVERDPDRYVDINVAVPGKLATWCDANGSHFIQVSSQAVFSGNEPPYGPDSKRLAMNAYGWQKIESEDRVRAHRSWTIARLTFVLGVRPLPHVGRENPLEQMLVQDDQKQVDDAWFSPLFARDAARQIWELVEARPSKMTVHLGIPISASRHRIAVEANRVAGRDVSITPVSRNDFPGLAPRPIDTTWDNSATTPARPISQDLARCVEDLANRCQGTREDMATDLALFLGITYDHVLEALKAGFIYYHVRIAEDFRKVDPKTDDEILTWYRQTFSYIWELAAYHTEPGDHYRKMCQGIAAALKAHEKREILCLGDGIGTLAIVLHENGLFPTYHDLAGSMTTGFGLFRFWRRFGHKPETNLTSGWQPVFFVGRQYDAIVALDYFEHLPNVEEWARKCVDMLKPGGLFLAQNAFGMGSGPEGSIPMHLTVNDRYEKDWDSLLDSLGLDRLVGNWRRKPE